MTGVTGGACKTSECATVSFARDPDVDAEGPPLGYWPALLLPLLQLGLRPLSADKLAASFDECGEMFLQHQPDGAA